MFDFNENINIEDIYSIRMYICIIMYHIILNHILPVSTYLKTLSGDLARDFNRLAFGKCLYTDVNVIIM